MGIIADFFLGQAKTKEIDMCPAIATITMDDGSVHTVSREGKEFSEWSMTGEAALEAYLHSKRTILRDDEGQYFPTCHIAKISVQVKSRIINLEYR